VWPIPELRIPLPEDLHACEDTDFLVLRCRRCGWVAVFSALGVDPEEIRRTACDHVGECSARL
jgi:hypothetical protein